ncbi:MAG: lytic transglycosylase domain-containing protein [Beijerinckiaceae bacterium]|nr:lytic transglycosylase domain-containing protein [Beijerinckiaceae bacterium]MDO9440602.1 lytic transglycosylase domain-containing protein [Beijerinckiaceae bacterium]
MVDASFGRRNRTATRWGALACAVSLLAPGAPAWAQREKAPVPDTSVVRELVNRHARLHGLPDTLAHRIVMRESRYNPRATGRGHYGLMQISLPTARQMGYTGAAAGLLEAETNLRYGMPYLANAWIVSGNNEARAVSLYSRGYYYEAKRKGLLRQLRTGATSLPMLDAARTQ